MSGGTSAQAEVILVSVAGDHHVSPHVDGTRSETMKAEIENPWAKMPRSAPFVLPEDEQFVAAFNAALGENFRDLHTIVSDVPPGAFAGPFDAPVVLLLANPGLDPNDRIELCTPTALDLIYRNLSSDVGGPGWVFDDHFADLGAVGGGAHGRGICQTNWAATTCSPNVFSQLSFMAITRSRGSLLL